MSASPCCADLLFINASSFSNFSTRSITPERKAKYLKFGYLEHGAQIFKKVGVELYHIFL